MTRKSALTITADTMKNWPREVRTLFLTVAPIGLVLAILRRWLTWRALETASPARRWVALGLWHPGMLRSSYYPVAGQRFVPWIQWTSVLGFVLLCGIALVFLHWARRSTSEPSARGR